ncbi:MAG: hypothetical protein K5751_13070 [Treponemataceae bacterium]|nr:hypothetical protein [Treponemataceae bacterium]
MCWKCGKPLIFNGSISRSDVCPVCGADVRACKNCRFYEPGAYYDCRENIDELVKDKERANFCGWFMLAAQPEAGVGDSANAASVSGGSSGSGSSSSNGAANSAADAFNALFGDKPAEKPASSGKDAFNALFGD